MAKLKLGPIVDEKPVRVTAELSAAVHRDLLAYAEAVLRETGQPVEAVQLVGPMLARFMATDRGFTKARKTLSAAKVRTTSDVLPMRPPEAAPHSESA